MEYNDNSFVELTKGPKLGDEQGWSHPQYYETIQFADIDGDGQAELIARAAQGIIWCKLDRVSNIWMEHWDGPQWSDKEYWNQPCYYKTIQCADIDGDGKKELLARSACGIEVWKFNGTSWVQLPNGPQWSDKEYWNQPCYYETIQCADIDGDGVEELLARSAWGIEVWKFNGTSWEQLPNGPQWGDAEGWSSPEYYRTIKCANIDGNAKGNELLGRGPGGINLYLWNN